MESPAQKNERRGRQDRQGTARTAYEEKRVDSESQLADHLPDPENAGRAGQNCLVYLFNEHFCLDRLQQSRSLGEADR